MGYDCLRRICSFSISARAAMAFPNLASEAARSAGIGGWFFISAAVVGGRFPVSEDLPEIAKSPSSFRKQLGTFNRYAFDHCTQRFRPSTRFHCARRMRSIMPAASRRFRAATTVERAIPAALAIVSREGSQRPEATLWKWKRRIRSTCSPVRFKQPPCLPGSRVLASIRSARKISRARCSRVSARYFTGSSVEPRRWRRFGLKSALASAYRLHTASFSSGVFAAFRSSLKSFQNSKLGCLSGLGRMDGSITRSMMTAICSTMDTTLLWRLKKRGSERGADNSYPWLEASKKCLIWGKGSDRIEGASNRPVQATAPLCGGFGAFGVVFVAVLLWANQAHTVAQKHLTLKRKTPSPTFISVPPCSLRPRGSSTQIFQARKGLKIRGPCEAPLASVARAGLPIGRSAPKERSFPVSPKELGKGSDAIN